jgi:hypothetical protein
MHLHPHVFVILFSEAFNTFVAMSASYLPAVPMSLFLINLLPRYMIHSYLVVCVYNIFVVVLS